MLLSCFVLVDPGTAAIHGSHLPVDVIIAAS